MSVQARPNYILQQRFEKLKLDRYVSTDSMSSGPSTPGTPCTPPTDPYEIEIIQKDDEEEVLDFLRRFFIRDEPLNVCIKLLDEENPRCVELEKFSLKDLDNGYNLKAVSDGKIIGVCLNGILKRGYIDEIGEINCPDKKFSRILKLLDYVAVKSDVFSHFPDVDKAMCVKILSVDGRWRGRGIAKDLMNKTRDLARENGCQLMTTDCSSHFTARALKRLGFNCIYELKYEDYRDEEGEVVFNPEYPHKSITVYTQMLD